MTKKTHKVVIVQAMKVNGFRDCSPCPEAEAEFWSVHVEERDNTRWHLIGGYDVGEFKRKAAAVKRAREFAETLKCFARFRDEDGMEREV